jgi:hypothetical protein
MRDEDLVEFINEFGEPTHRTTVPAESIERWRGRLPDQLLTYWQQEGWCGYANGLIWTVDPEDYEDLIDEWLEDTPLEGLDSFHVIARTAFGDLFACGEKVGPVVNVSCQLHAVFALARELRAKSQADLDFEVRGFFGGSTRRGCDMTTEHDGYLFERAVKKLGPLAPDEMFALEPALAAGGTIALENLARVKLDPHLTILRQLAAPTMPYANLDIDKLMRA